MLPSQSPASMPRRELLPMSPPWSRQGRKSEFEGWNYLPHPPQERRRAALAGSQIFQPFEHVQPSLSQLALGNVLLGPMQPCRQLDLRQSSLLARFTQERQNQIVTGCMKDFRPPRAGIGAYSSFPKQATPKWCSVWAVCGLVIQFGNMHSRTVLMDIYKEHRYSVPLMIETLFDLDVPAEDARLLGIMPWEFPANRIAVERERLGLSPCIRCFTSKLPPPPRPGSHPPSS